jgi:photosystem II stability/assembly factor-like uncharacterized protein
MRGITVPFALFVLLTLVPFQGQVMAQSSAWIQTAGPYGGVVTALIVSRKGTVFAGTGTGAFRTTDNGATWSQPPALALTASVRSFALDSNGALFAVTAEGMYRTTDDGGSWQPYGNRFTDLYSAGFDRQGRMYAGGTSKIYQFIDSGGGYWRQLSYVTSNGTVNSICTTPNGTIYAGATQGAIFRSTDRFKSWSVSDEGIYCGDVRSIAFDRKGYLYAATQCDLYRSTNAGASWDALTGPVSGRDIRVVAVDGGYLWAGTFEYGIFRSSDAGATWQEMYVGMQSPSVRAFAAAPNGDIYCGTPHGVERSADNGEHWEVTDRGLTATSIKCMLTNSRGWVFAGTETGMWRTTDGGTSWKDINYQLTNRNVNCLSLDADGSIWLGTATSPGDHPAFPGAVFRSTDDGDSWTNLHFPDAHGIGGITFGQNGRVLVGATGWGAHIWRTSDLGGTWAVTSKDLLTVGMATGKAGVIYAITPDYGLWQSLDNGSNWSRVTAVGNGLQVATDGNGRVCVTGADGFTVFTSSNDGDSWVIYDRSQRPCSETGPIAFDKNGVLLMGSDCGLLRSTTAGYAWLPDTLGMDGTEISAIGIAPAGRLYVGTPGHGVFRQGAPLTVPSGAESPAVPAITDLQVVPNPSNAPTSISFTLEAPLHLSLALRDPEGRPISPLADRQFESGPQSIAFDTGGLASGVYYVVIAGGGKIETRRFVVVR